MIAEAQGAVSNSFNVIKILTALSERSSRTNDKQVAKEVVADCNISRPSNPRTLNRTLNYTVLKKSKLFTKKDMKLKN